MRNVTVMGRALILFLTASQLIGCTKMANPEVSFLSLMLSSLKVTSPSPFDQDSMNEKGFVLFEGECPADVTQLGVQIPGLPWKQMISSDFVANKQFEDHDTHAMNTEIDPTTLGKAWNVDCADDGKFTFWIFKHEFDQYLTDHGVADAENYCPPAINVVGKGAMSVGSVSFTGGNCNNNGGGSNKPPDHLVITTMDSPVGMIGPYQCREYEVRVVDIDGNMVEAPAGVTFSILKTRTGKNPQAATTSFAFATGNSPCSSSGSVGTASFSMPAHAKSMRFGYSPSWQVGDVEYVSGGETPVPHLKFEPVTVKFGSTNASHASTAFEVDVRSGNTTYLTTDLSGWLVRGLCYPFKVRYSSLDYGVSAASGPLNLGISGTDIKFYSNASCSTETTSATMGLNQTYSNTIWLKYTPGAVVVASTASSTIRVTGHYPGAEAPDPEPAAMTINWDEAANAPATKLGLWGDPQIWSARTPASYSVRLLNKNDAPVYESSSRTINLVVSGVAGRGAFYASCPYTMYGYDCSNEPVVTSVTIPAGQLSVDVMFLPKVGGYHDLTASSASLSPKSMTVEAAGVTGTDVQTVAAAAHSDCVSVQFGYKGWDVNSHSEITNMYYSEPTAKTFTVSGFSPDQMYSDNSCSTPAATFAIDPWNNSKSYYWKVRNFTATSQTRTLSASFSGAPALNAGTASVQIAVGPALLMKAGASTVSMGTTEDLYPHFLVDQGTGPYGLSFMSGVNSGSFGESVARFSSAASDTILNVTDSKLPTPTVSGNITVTVLAPRVEMDFVNSWIPSDDLLTRLKKSIKVDNVQISGGVYFQRFSGATVVDANGSLQTMAAGEPRFDYDPITHARKGLLIEGSSMNDVSTDFSTWTGVVGDGLDVVRSPGSPAPDGSTSVRMTYNGDAAAGPKWLGADTTYTVDMAQWFTASMFVKHPSGDVKLTSLFRVEDMSSGANGGVLLDFKGSSGAPRLVEYNSGYQVVLNGFGADPFPNGWYRIWFRFQAPSGMWGHSISLRMFPIWNLDGIDAVNHNQDLSQSGDLDVFGPQLERQATMTSYIPCAAGGCARAAETLKLERSGGYFGGWMSQDEGTFKADLDIAHPSEERGVIASLAYSSTGVTSYLTLETGLNSPRDVGFTVPGMGIQGAIPMAVVKPGANKMAMSYSALKNMILAASREGSAPNASMSQLSSSTNFLYLGGDGRTDGSRRLNGNIKTLKYWDTALSDAAVRSMGYSP